MAVRSNAEERVPTCSTDSPAVEATVDPAVDPPLTAKPPGTAAEPDTPTRCSRCGASTHVDEQLTEGRGIRRDCGRCGQFLEFVEWTPKGAEPVAA